MTLFRTSIFVLRLEHSVFVIDVALCVTDAPSQESDDSFRRYKSLHEIKNVCLMNLPLA
jgi:hypothetical protein